jgi:hypothetical protein
MSFHGEMVCDPLQFPQLILESEKKKKKYVAQNLLGCTKKKYVAQNLLGCTTVFLIECRSMFQKYVLPSSLG